MQSVDSCQLGQHTVVKYEASRLANKKSFASATIYHRECLRVPA